MAIFLFFGCCLFSCDSSEIIELGLDEYLLGKTWESNRVSTVTIDSTVTTESSNVTLTFIDECTLLFNEGNNRTKYFYYLSETHNEIDIFKTGFSGDDDKNGFSIFSVDKFEIKNKTAEYMLWTGQDTVINNTTGTVSHINKTWELSLVQ